MGLETEQIKEQLALFASRFGPVVIMPATVTAINDDRTIQVLFDNGLEIDDVRLKAVVKEGDEFVMLPVVGSTVLVGCIAESDDFVLVAASEVSEVFIKIGKTELKVNEKFSIKTKDDSLLGLMKDLIDAILSEKHMTNSGPSISLTPDSQLLFNNIKTRFSKLLNEG